MTKEKSIEIIQELWRYKETDKYTETEIRQALDIAIKALEQPDIDIEKFSPKKDDIMVVSFDRDEVYPEDLGDLATQLGTKYPDINFLFFPNNYDIKEYEPEVVRKRMQDIIDWTYKIEKGENDEAK